MAARTGNGGVLANSKADFGPLRDADYAGDFMEEHATMVNMVTEDALERARQALSLSPVFALRSLQVEHEDGSLLLHGCVASFYHKQLAQEAVRAVAVGTPLINTIEVAPASPRLPR